MPRMPDIAVENMSPEQRRVHDAIISGPRGVVPGPLRVWLNSPELAERAQTLGAFCRYGTVLPPHLSELAIITTGAYWRAGYEWAVHAPIALQAGINADVIEAIRTGKRPDFEQADAAALYGFTHELLHNRKVSQATYRRAEQELGNRALVDLIGILGYYGLICMTIVAFEVPAPQGADPFASSQDQLDPKK
jgi:4-carboxymuconolactone decarboxylase